MNWILNYQLFLFDFDGLLVDTERVHYQAYIEMCAWYGFKLPWTFARFTEAAHIHATALRDQIYVELPELHAKEPNWQVLYEKKKQHFLDLIENQPVPLMPGVEKLLLALKESKIPSVVVTHSAENLIKNIRKHHPLLDSIHDWVTRENYREPKPHPECYQFAIAKFSKENDTIIGFEDSPRGMDALLQTRAKPVLISPPDSPYLKKYLARKQLDYFPSFEAIPEFYR